MKILVSLALLTVAQSTSMDQILKSCGEKTHIVDPEDVWKTIITPGFRTNDPTIKCFGKCVGETQGFMTTQGVLVVQQAETIHDIIDRQRAKAAFMECQKLLNADPCETAYLQWTCAVTRVKI